MDLLLQKTFAGWHHLYRRSKAQRTLEGAKETTDARIAQLIEYFGERLLEPTSESTPSLAYRDSAGTRSSKSVALTISSSGNTNQQASERSPCALSKSCDKSYLRLRERAEERKRKHADYARKRQEAEQAAAEAKQRQETEETQAKLARKTAEARERHNRLAQEQALKAKKEFQAEALRIKIDMAEQFDRRRLVLSYGFHPWKNYASDRKEMLHKASSYHDFNSKRTVLQSWHAFVQGSLRLKEESVQACFQRLWKRICLGQFLKLIQSKYATEMLFRTLTTKIRLRRIVTAWKCFTTDEQIRYLSIGATVSKILDRVLLEKYLTSWTHLPSAMENQRNRNAYIKQLIALTQQMIPDFAVPETYAEEWELDKTSFRPTPRLAD